MPVRVLVLLLFALPGCPVLAQSTTTAPDLEWIETRHVEFNGLDGAFDIVAASNELDLYVSGFLDDSIVHLLRNPLTGALTWVATYRDGEGGVSGLDGPEQLALSPDGTSLYAAVNQSDGLVSFARDPATGVLTWQAHATTAGLERAASVAVHPSGDRIYVGSFVTGTLQVFGRTPPAAPVATYSVQDSSLVGALSIAPVPVATGTLLYVAGSTADTLSVWLDTGSSILPVQSFTDGIGGLDGLEGVNDIAMSSDGRHLYASAFGDGALAHFTRDAQGLLSWVSASNDLGALQQPNRIVLQPDGERIYVSLGGADRVRSFPVDPITGEISYPPPERGGGLSPLAAADTPYGLLLQGEHLYVAALGGDAVIGYRVDEFPNGPPEQTEAYSRWGVASSLWDPIAETSVPLEQRARGLHSLIALPGDPVFGYQRLVGAQQSPYGGVTSWLVDRQTGATQPEWTLGAPEAGAARLLATGNGEFLYVGREDDTGGGRIEVWQMPYGGDDPTLVQSRPLSRGAQASDVRAMVFDAGENNLYLASGNGAVQRYTRDPLTGEVTFADGSLGAGWSEALDLAITPSGEALYLTVRNTDGVVRWPLQPDGALGSAPVYVGVAPIYQAPANLEVSPDGSQLLVTTQFLFRLHNAAIQSDGALAAPQTMVTQGQPRSLTLGPDGAVYTGVNASDRLAEVHRFDATGQLVWAGRLGADVCATTTSCAAQPAAVATSTDGQLVFTAAAGSAFGSASGGLFVHRDRNVIFGDGFELGGLWAWSANSLPF